MDKCLQPHAHHRRQFSSRFEIIDFLLLFLSFFNFEYHNLSFLGGYIPPESPSNLYDISGEMITYISQW